MTDRPTNEEQKAQAETPTMPDFSRYMVCDSYSVPATDTTPAGDAPEPHRRLSRQQLISLDARLSIRDKDILLAVRRHRYLLSGQVQRLLFTDAANSTAGLRAASRNLKKLCDLGLIDSLSRRIGGVRAGSSSLVWHITHAGERLLRLYDHKAYPSKRFFEPSPYYLAHTLAVAEVCIQLTELCGDNKSQLAALQPEPECWRTYSELGKHVALKPDLYAAVVSEEYEDRYFIEVDLGTESPAKIIEKCQKYHAYYRSGLEQEESEMFPLTVWIVPTIKRKEHLLSHIRNAFVKQPKLFAVITSEELEQLIRDGGDETTLC